MNRMFIAAIAIGAAVVAIVMARGMSAGTNIAEREKYWTKEIAGKLKPGASKEELAAFARERGQPLRCYTNYKREPQCDFEDRESRGGSRNMPMRLSMIFPMKDDKVAGHELATGPIEARR